MPGRVRNRLTIPKAADGCAGTVVLAGPAQLDPSGTNTGMMPAEAVEQQVHGGQCQDRTQQRHLHARLYPGVGGAGWSCHDPGARNRTRGV